MRRAFSISQVSASTSSCRIQFLFVLDQACAALHRLQGRTNVNIRMLQFKDRKHLEEGLIAECHPLHLIPEYRLPAGFECQGGRRRFAAYISHDELVFIIGPELLFDEYYSIEDLEEACQFAYVATDNDNQWGIGEISLLLFANCQQFVLSKLTSSKSISNEEMAGICEAFGREVKFQIYNVTFNVK